jgi:hypothetical protein
MKKLLYDAMLNAIQNPESSDSLPGPRAIADALMSKAKEGDTAAVGLILQIADFEPKEQ